MQKIILALFLAVLGLTSAAQANDEPGRFDYWMLSLSWSPQYCSERERDPQCTRVYNFVVHGLWPQFEQDGYPQNCADVERVDKDLVSRMMLIMPSPTLVQHQWQKHGSCSGMEAKEYFLNVERVHRSLIIPAAYQEVPKHLTTTAQEIRDAFIQSNPGLAPEMMSLTCSGRYLKEIRICYDKDYQPRDCSGDIRDRCGKRVILRPTR